MEKVAQTKDEKKRERFFSESRKALNFVYIYPGNPDKNTQTGFEYFRDPGREPDFRIPDDLGDKPVIVKDGFVEYTPSKRATKAELILIKLSKATKRQDLAPFKFKLRFEKVGPDGTFKSSLFANTPPKNTDLKLYGVGSQLDLKRLAVIRRMSAKNARIIELVHSDFKYTNEGEFTYYYHPWLKNGGGILLGICFELMGYERLDGLSDDATLLSDKPRYAFMMGEPGGTNARNRNIKRIVNHPLNRFGDKVRIIIASDVTSTGLSFTNVRKFIHGGPSFNLIRQPEGRTNRADSHRAFSKPEQKYVRRFLMAATLSDGTQTLDHQIWYKIQEKESVIIPIRTVLGEISTDCAFNAQSDTLCIGSKFDVNGKRLPSLPPDYTTYHLHWAQQEFGEIEQKIRHYFLINSSYSFDDLVVLLSDKHHMSTITWTLTNMLSRKDIIRDRFGFARVIREHNGIYYLGTILEYISKESLPSPHQMILHDRLTESYVKNLRIPYAENFQHVTSTATVIQQAQIPMTRNLESFKRIWQTTDGATRVVQLEKALTRQIDSEEISNFIMRDLAVVWFKDHSSIFHYLEEMRPKGNSGGYQNNRNRINGKKTPIVIRILVQNEQVFRNANSVETIRAINIINARWSAREDEVNSRSGVCFTVIHNISSDRKIRIKINKSTEALKKDDTPDLRKGNKGLLTNLYDNISLVGFLWDLDIENPHELDHDPGTPDLLARRIPKLGIKMPTKGWSHKRNLFYWKWLKDDGSGLNDRMANTIFKYFELNDLILRK